MAAQGPVTGYEALTCMFLRGGNESNNWILPADTTTFTDYTSIRGNSSPKKTALLPRLTGPSAHDPAYQDDDGNTYGAQPALSQAPDLFR